MVRVARVYWRVAKAWDERHGWVADAPELRLRSSALVELGNQYTFQYLGWSGGHTKKDIRIPRCKTPPPYVKRGWLRHMNCGVDSFPLPAESQIYVPVDGEVATWDVYMKADAFTRYEKDLCIEILGPVQGTKLQEHLWPHI